MNADQLFELYEKLPNMLDDELISNYFHWLVKLEIARIHGKSVESWWIDLHSMYQYAIMNRPSAKKLVLDELAVKLLP